MARRKTRPAYEPLGEGGGQLAGAALSVDVPADLLATLRPETAGEARPLAPETNDTPHYHGHRERLRERFRNAGADALPDYELLELVLFRTMRQGDTKPLAKRLIENSARSQRCLMRRRRGLRRSRASVTPPSPT
jgi:hypothetical protein